MYIKRRIGRIGKSDSDVAWPFVYETGISLWLDVHEINRLSSGNAKLLACQDSKNLFPHFFLRNASIYHRYVI